VRGDRAAAAARRARPGGAAFAAARAGAPAHGAGVDPAGPRPCSRRPLPRRSRGGRAHRDGEPRCGLVDEPGRVDQPGRDLGPWRTRRLVRGRHRHARALARDRARAARGAGHRRDQPCRAARRAGGDVVARGPAAAADRHALRPVRGAGARALELRDLRGWPVDPGGNAVGRLARPRGRRPPVDRHAGDRNRAARLRGLGARLRPGLRMGLPGRTSAPRPSRRLVGVLPPDVAAHRPGLGRPARGRCGAGAAPPPRSRRRLCAVPRRRRAARRGAGRRRSGHPGDARGGTGAARRGRRGRGRRLPDQPRPVLPGRDGSWSRGS
jgi:hypothetical protein